MASEDILPSTVTGWLQCFVCQVSLFLLLLFLSNIFKFSTMLKFKDRKELLFSRHF